MLLLPLACTAEPQEIVIDPGGEGFPGLAPTPGEPTDPEQAPPGPTPPSTEDPDAGIGLGDIPITLAERSSSRLVFRWSAVPGAKSIRVFVGPEPKGDAERLPHETSIVTLDGQATEVSIERLAALTDLFVYVEANTEDGSLWGIGHGRTLGGARAALDTPLRSVHAVAPNVLLLVFATRETRYANSALSGTRGRAWQGGQWEVQRADGRQLPVTAVRRRSVPVGQPSYQTGWEKYGTDTIVDVDDHVFLVLGEAIGQRELLEVRHSGEANTGLDVLVPFSDRYLETPLLKVNQVGYNPRATRRYAYLQAYLGDGGQVDLTSLEPLADVLADARNPLRPKRQVVSELPVEQRSANDAEAGGRVHQIDLASVPAAEGVRYRVRVPGVGVSYPTAISEDAALKAFYVTARGLFLNRWCGDLAEKYTDWGRRPDHCSAYFVQGRSYRDGMFPTSTARTNERPVLGGHHDAGDFDIRPFHVVVAQYLMRAFEANRDAFHDGQLHLPESGNGIPDLLDEALHSLRGWEDLQNSDGSIRAGVESSHHPRGYYFADEDQLPYWTYDPEPWHTAYVAGLFAQAAHLVKPFDAERSSSLVGKAQRAYDWARGRGAPSEFLLYATSELARATGQATHESAFTTLWSGLGGTSRVFGRLRGWSDIYPGSFTGNTPLLLDYFMGAFSGGKAGAAFGTGAVGTLHDRARATAQRFLQSEHAMRNGRPRATPPDWGRSVGAGLHADSLYQSLSLTTRSGGLRQDEYDALSLAADYVLGGNPNGMVYVTGLGSVSPQEPLHTDSLVFIKRKGMPPMPGIPVYGPVNALPSASWYAPLAAAFHPPFSQQPLALRHVDSRTSVNTSEFSVWESQAPLAALLASLAPGHLPPEAWSPGGPEHRSPLPSHVAD